MNMLEHLRTKLREALDEIEKTTTTALEEERELTDDEEELVSENQRSAETLKGKIEKYEKIEALREKAPAQAKKPVQQRGDGSDTKVNEIEVLERKSTGELVKVKREPLTYEYGNRERVFFRDLFHYVNRYNGMLGRIDNEAVEAIERHLVEMQSVDEGRFQQSQEIERSVTTGGMASIVTPQYLLDLYAPGLYDGAVSRAVFAKYPLPEVGTSFTFPRNTTRGMTAPQREGDTVQESTPVNTDTELRLSTVAGFTDMTNQSMDRGVMVESLVANEIMGAYYEDINEQILFGNGARDAAGAIQQRGLFSVIGGNTVATDVNYTDATPTLVEFWQKIIQELGRFLVLRKRRCDAILMDPITWSLLYSAVDADNRPLFQHLLTLASNVFGVGDPAMADVQMPEPVGGIMNIPVWTDPAIPDTFTQAGLRTGGTQHRTALIRREDCILLESASGPVSATYQATEAKSLQQTLVVYGYVASTVERYQQGARVLRGTGMILG